MMDKAQPEYTIDALIETFERHAIESEKQDVTMRAKWKENNGEEYPHEKFNICWAFLTMVKEIKRLSDG